MVFEESGVLIRDSILRFATLLLRSTIEIVRLIKKGIERNSETE